MRRSFVGCLVLWVAWSGAAAGAEKWLGSWKLNTAKSQLGANAIRAQTLKFESTPNGIKLTSDGIDAQGRPMKSGYTAKFDGTCAAWAGNPVADEVCPKRIDDNSYENVWKKGGKATVTAKIVVSKDGKNITVTQVGTDPRGGKVSAVAVYDRQ
jgi:hypothetical protein